MGKGFNNYMTKKFFHPSSKDNIKRKWMAEQKTAYEKKQQEDLLAQYQKEQEVLSNRALLGDEKAKMGLSFLYDAPPGLKKKEEPESQQEVKFEWQRKYNAPREAYAKDDDTIRDQPFGIEVRNVRCIKCRQWGHVNTDKICPLFGKNLTAEPEMPGSSNSSVLDSLKQDGFTLKDSVLGRLMETDSDKQHNLLSREDDDDPEVQFLKSLTPKQKKKLLKKLNRLQSGSSKGVGKQKKKGKKSKKLSRSDTDSDSEDDRKKHKKSSGKKPSSSSDSAEEERRHKHTSKRSKRRQSTSEESSDDGERRHKQSGHRVARDRRHRSPEKSKHREQSRRSRSRDRSDRR